MQVSMPGSGGAGTAFACASNAGLHHPGSPTAPQHRHHAQVPLNSFSNLNPGAPHPLHSSAPNTSLGPTPFPPPPGAAQQPLALRAPAAVAVGSSAPGSTRSVGAAGAGMGDGSGPGSLAHGSGGSGGGAASQGQGQGHGFSASSIESTLLAQADAGGECREWVGGR